MKFSVFMASTAIIGVLAGPAMAQVQVINSFSMPDATDFQNAVIEAGLNIGYNAPAPNFALPRASGGVLTLGDVLAKGPALVMFVNGATFSYNWPKMELLNHNMPKFNALGIQVVVIAPDTLQTLQQFQQRAQFKFELLSDANYIVSRQFGMMQMKTPVPALYSINQQGRMVGLQVRDRFNLNEAVAPLRGAVQPAMPAPQATPQQMPTPDARMMDIPGGAPIYQPPKGQALPPPQMIAPTPVIPAVPSPQVQ